MLPLNQTGNPTQSINGYFLIRSKLNGFVLDLAGSNPASGNYVLVHPANGPKGAPNQQWRVTPEGLLKSKLNDFVLEIPQSKQEPFTPVVVYPANGSGTSNQQWTITQAGLIVSKLNGFALDILGSSLAPFTPVVIHPVNGTNGSLNQQWELIPIEEEQLPQQGPIGSQIKATEFEIQPEAKAPRSRIKAIRLRSDWGIDQLQVQYENLATQPSQTYESVAVGGNGGHWGEFCLDSADYLTKITGTWGRLAMAYPMEDIVSLQFVTSQGVNSPVFGGNNPKREVVSFSLEAPQGYEIIGFFGAYGTVRNVLVRLGVYLKPVV